jgi:hypothetical protein
VTRKRHPAREHYRMTPSASLAKKNSSCSLGTAFKAGNDFIRALATAETEAAVASE